MKIGKISESVLKRSVLKYIYNEQTKAKIRKGAGIGEDCAFFEWKEGQKELFAVSTETITLPVENALRLAILAAANNLAAGGAEPLSVSLSITLPFEEEAEGEEPNQGKSGAEKRNGDFTAKVKKEQQEKHRQERQLAEMMKQAGDCCRELGLLLTGGHTEVSAAVRTPVVTATAMGALDAVNRVGACDPPKGKAGLFLVMTKWIGLEGTAILAREKEKELLARYPYSLIRGAQELDRFLSLIPEAATALRSGVHTMHDMRNGGVFGGLWELSKRLGVGLSVDLKKIPVKQETIEICEFYDLNPYELLSGGSLLLAAENGEELAERLWEQGIFASVIGRTTDSNDKILINDEETRFLEPAKPDALLKIKWN